MAILKKALTAVNDIAGPLTIPTDLAYLAGIQLPAGSAGTYVLEGNINGTDWVTVQVAPAGGGTLAGTMAAAGVFQADLQSLNQVRVRKTVGTVAEIISLLITRR